ncbi:MAG: hypothetical protein AB8B94_05915 [Hyphomicrobiales bacterium]
MNMTMKSIAIVSAMTAAAFIGYGAATFQSHALGADGHSAHTQSAGQPKEAGQAAFAAIAEIVTILTNDPDTDWEKVNIDQLREHLVDMNMLTTEAAVEKSVNGDTVEFKVSGQGATLRAIQAMVPAHSKELAKIPGWRVVAETTDTGAILQVGSDTATELTKINALGFFGLMATGTHHQPHHLGMAKGIDHIHH